MLQAHDRSARRAPVARFPRRAWRIAVLTAPALWVVGVVALSLALQLGVQLTPLLAAAPAIACVGTGRRQCIALGCLCALLALIPFQPDSDAFGERLGTAPTILIVTFASYLIAQRRLRTQRAYDDVRRIADVTQRVLLRPLPARIGPVTAAVEYLSAASGAQIGGDFYEIIETPYGVRAILGDMRGNGLDAVSGAATLLGAFREAGAVEPALEAVARRLDAALTRRARELRRVELARATDRRQDGLAGLWAEDFATAVLVQIPYGAADDAAAPSTADDPRTGWHGQGGGEATLVLCGHPAPFLVRGGETRAVEPAPCGLPLGLGPLAAEPYAVTGVKVPFAVGDTLVLYTDGVSDARTRGGSFFPLSGLLHDVHDLSPDEIADFLRNRLLEHVLGALHDDAAMVVLRRHE